MPQLNRPDLWKLISASREKDRQFIAQFPQEIADAWTAFIDWRSLEIYQNFVPEAPAETEPKQEN